MLFTGSEGTLGIITKIILRLLPTPKASKTVVAVFNNIAIACAAVTKMISSSILPAKIELIDKMLLKRFEELFPSGLPVDTQTILLIQADGLPETVSEEAKQVLDICRRSGAGEAMIAKDQAEAERFWQARRAGFSDVFGSAHTVLSEDVCVPRGRIAEFIEKCQDTAKKYDLAINLMGHAGDGNLHVNVMFDENTPEEKENVHAVVKELFRKVIEMGGTISGEHGIGITKAPYLDMEISGPSLDLMARVKKAFDPRNILNPGKIFRDL